MEPPCTKRVNGNLIDFRDFKDKELIVNSGKNRSFAISLCGAAKSCNNPSISACEITNNTIKEIAGVNQVIQFANNVLTIKATLQSKTSKYTNNDECNNIVHAF